MAILVTGGAGFIGSNLIDRLLAEGEEVVCLDNFNNDYNPGIKRKNIEHNIGIKGFELVEADLAIREKLAGLLKKYEISRVVHLAAKTNPRLSFGCPSSYFHNNIVGTANLLDECRNIDIENFIFASSSSIYGNNNLPFKETDKTDIQLSPYAASKKGCELICSTYGNLYGIPMSCLRLFSIYGPRQRPDMAIHRFTRMIESGKAIEIYGNGNTKRDYTYVDDVVNGIISAIKKRFEFEIFNLGGGRTTELNRIVSLIEDKINKKARIKHLPLQNGDVSATCADIRKADKILGYKPEIRIEEGIERFVEWYKGVLEKGKL